MKTLIQVVAFALVSSSAAQAQQAVQWRVQDGGNGHWYQFRPSPLPRDEASAAARTQGAELASITTLAENAFVGVVAAGNSCWIGGNQPTGACEPGCSWSWLDGEAWGFTQWGSGEPNDGGGGTAGEQGLEFRPSGHWNDYWTWRTLPAIIEWSADCNADGIVDYGQILEGHLPDVNSNAVADGCECSAFPTLPACCIGDLNADRTVDGTDLGILLASWGPCQACPADINDDGAADGADLGVLLNGWGPCPPMTPTWATLVEAAPDPAIVSDPQLRAAIQATGMAWRVRDTATQIEMLLVPPGTFQMGCSASALHACLDNELPVRPVTLTSAFYLGRYEVTQQQWVARMSNNPSMFQGQPNSDARPVERVSKAMVQSFMAATGLRLPTEAEWEYACRASTSTAFSNGSSDDASMADAAWFAANNDPVGTKPVGLKAANRLGFHDMHGNVWEWVSDLYSPTYYSVGPTVDPPGPPSGGQVVRGGCWQDSTMRIRSSSRVPFSVSSDENGGFRVARNP